MGITDSYLRKEVTASNGNNEIRRGRLIKEGKGKHKRTNAIRGRKRKKMDREMMK